MNQAEFRGKGFAIALLAFVCWGIASGLFWLLYAAGKWLHLW